MQKFLHPVTSSASIASEVEHEEPGGRLLSPPATGKKIPSLAARLDELHGFTTYWMIKKAPSCTVHSVENTANHQKDGVGQYTVLTVSLGEADQTTEIPVPQQCHFACCCFQQHWKSRSVKDSHAC